MSTTPLILPPLQKPKYPKSTSKISPKSPAESLEVILPKLKLSPTTTTESQNAKPKRGLGENLKPILESSLKPPETPRPPKTARPSTSAPRRRKAAPIVLTPEKKELLEELETHETNINKRIQELLKKYSETELSKLYPELNENLKRINEIYTHLRNNDVSDEELLALTEELMNLEKEVKDKVEFINKGGKKKNTVSKYTLSKEKYSYKKKEYTIYYGKRNGKYIKINNKYKSISSLMKNKK